MSLYLLELAGHRFLLHSMLLHRAAASRLAQEPPHQKPSSWWTPEQQVHPTNGMHGDWADAVNIAFAVQAKWKNKSGYTSPHPLLLLLVVQHRRSRYISPHPLLLLLVVQHRRSGWSNQHASCCVLLRAAAPREVENNSKAQAISSKHASLALSVAPPLLQGSQTFACRRSSIIRVGPAYNPVGTTPQDEQFMENTP
ncbi:hypothetical protein WJX79_011064 [Trebouxia sp. C0005]